MMAIEDIRQVKFLDNIMRCCEMEDVENVEGIEEWNDIREHEGSEGSVKTKPFPTSYRNNQTPGIRA